MVRYSFLVGLFHPQLHAGLSRRLRLLTRAALFRVPRTLVPTSGAVSSVSPRLCASKGDLVGSCYAGLGNGCAGDLKKGDQRT